MPRKLKNSFVFSDMYVMQLTFLALLLALLQNSLAFASSKEVTFFLNLNYSSGEVKALEDAARKSEEEWAKKGIAKKVEVVVIPPREMIPVVEGMFKLRNDLSAKIKKERPALKDDELKVMISDIMLRGSDWNRDPGIAQKFSDEIANLRRAAVEVNQLENKMPSIYEQARARLAKLKSQGKRIDRFVLSAHTDGVNATGETSTRLNGGEMSLLKDEYPDAFLSPRHVLLLGCYNLNKANYPRWRMSLFPRTRLVAGYGDKAYLRWEQRGLDLIRDLLNTSDALDLKSIDTPLPRDTIQKAFLSLKTVTGISTVIDYCYEVMKGKPDAMETSCQEQWLTFINQAKLIREQYISPQTLSIDPPSTDRDSPLRQFYGMLQSTCPASEDPTNSKEDAIAGEVFRTDIKEAVLRLMFWWNIQQNFQTYYENDIAQLQLQLNRAGVDATLPTFDGRMGRVEFVKRYREIEKAMRERLSEIRKLRSSIIASPANRADRLELIKQEDLLQRAERAFSIYKPLYFLSGESGIRNGITLSDDQTLAKGGIPMGWISPGVVQKARTP